MKPCDPIYENELSIRCDRFHATYTLIEREGRRERKRKRDTRYNGTARRRLTIASRIVYVLNIKRPEPVPSVGGKKTTARLDRRGFERRLKNQATLSYEPDNESESCFSFSIYFPEFETKQIRVRSRYLNILIVEIYNCKSYFQDKPAR